MLQQWRSRLFIREKITQDLRCLIFLHFQVQIKHIIWQTFVAWMSFQTWIRAMEFSSHLAIQFVDCCKCLVYVASLVAHLLLFFVLIGLDIVKTLPRCYLKLTLKNFSCKKNTDNDTASLWCCNNKGHGSFHSREKNSRWLARKLTTMFHMSFETCCWRGHLSGCFNAPHFLLTRVPSSTPFPNSLAYIQIAACLLICVLPSAFKKFCSNKQGVICAWSALLFLLAKVHLSTRFPIRAFPHTPCRFPLSVDPADCFQGILFKQWQTSQSNKFGFLKHI